MRILFSLPLLRAGASGLAALLALLGPGGCSPDNELSGPPAASTAPDTRLEGQTPTALGSSISVSFAWSGHAGSASVAGYQWKLCPVGEDGIGEADTLSADPATGMPVHPWRFTTATDSTFVITPEQVPGQPVVYVFLVRAVDGAGRIDPTPAYLGFGPETLLPQIYVDRPAVLVGQQTALPAPPTVTFGYSGLDPDWASGAPIRCRYLWKRALAGEQYVDDRFDFARHVDELVSFADSGWTGWFPYPEAAADRVVTFADQPALDAQGRRISYIFALQVQDTTGAVSLDRLYGANVMNVFISDSFTPELTVSEYYLGTFTTTGINVVREFEIAQGQPLRFQWVATANGYAGIIASYRWGWDLSDPDDPDDPGWAVWPGLSPAHRMTPEQSFTSGVHTLTIQCRDYAAQMARMQFALAVVPVPDPASQKPLLLVDDVVDRSSQGWPDALGTPRDRDADRDDFWNAVLTGSGGVSGFAPGQDVIDLEAGELAYRDLVQYRTVIWATRGPDDNFIADHFRPLPGGRVPYLWLSVYQRVAGDILLAGSRATESFIEPRRWMTPWIFTATRLTGSFGAETFDVGFGTRVLPDGSVVAVGTERYPYRTLGLSALDHVTPQWPFHVYGDASNYGTGRGARSPECSGVKALRLDPAFALQHGISAAAFPDTILTNSLIDWQDQDPMYRERLLAWQWGTDEFYDADIVGRPPEWLPQDCGGTPCVEPMLRIVSRFAWVDEEHENAGDPDWPAPHYGGSELPDICGQHALSDDGAAMRTDGRILGFVSHTLVAEKPSGRGDVIWGFDPYRFDAAGMGPAIRWVLGEHFGLVMNP